ncbi:RHS repeat-associated core domain-containing protein [Asanoa sp. NPDC049518]|uniref:RHS repeat-associated core domain-containing protein n=1 Tax=unclassified Asanoa TaxID=2685164 RepID=UPI00341D7EDC
MSLSGGRSRTTFSRFTRYVAAAVTGMVVATTLMTMPAAATAVAVVDRPAPGVPAQPAPAAGVRLKAEKPKPDPTAEKTMRVADNVAWPVGGAAEIDAAQTDSRLQNVGGLSIDVATTGSAGRARVDAPRRARVQVFGQATAKSLRADGPVFRLHRPDNANDAAVRVRVGYEQFAHARGGDWGARLQLVALPACALTSPEKSECRTKRVLPTVNEAGGQVLSADVNLSANESSAMLLTMAASQSSSQGSYKATTLSQSSSWSVSMASGAFAWTYPISVPTTAGGFGPQVGLAYSSQTVDGRTAATNNQGSWVGEGFGYEPGYIERRYKPCKDDGHDNSAEQCWAFQNGVMMLSGHSGSLIKVNDDQWKLSSDDGSKVERLTGMTNGDDNGEYWKVTTTDGTQYFFGRNRLPGWVADKEETRSVWTMPVYGDDAGEPCNDSSGFSSSWCQQAWRWNLDYVVDPRGNVISYFYGRETNYYAREGKTNVDGTMYHRAGYLSRIDYGQRHNQVYSTNAPARVVFHTDERCISTPDVDCDPQDLNENTAASWPDVPEDLVCAASSHCEWTQSAATFFTRRRLTSVETQVRQGSGWQPVTSWTLDHEFKRNDDNSRTLWLKSITQTGHWGGTAVPLPPTELYGIQLDNRIVRDSDLLGPLIRYRLATVKTDSGAQITINYKAADCNKDNLPAPGSSTRRCFPVIWNPLGGDEEDEDTDWFHKYVVANVVTDDLVGGNDDMVSSYDYKGDAGWRKTEPDGITKAEDLTWSDWRGYGQVIMRTGDNQTLSTRSDHFFLRGLSGGKKADGSRPPVTRTDSTGTSYTDYDEWSGHELETVIYNGSSVVSKEISQPWRRVTHTQNETWGDPLAVLVRTAAVHKLVAMPNDPQGNEVWRETKSASAFDARGRITGLEDLGDLNKSGDETCTRTWFADAPDSNMYTLVSRIQTVSVKCDVADPNLATHLLSDTRTSYDFKPWGAVPTTGTATLTEDLDKYDGAKIVYIRKSETLSVDDYGRPTATKNALGGTTTTQYTDTDGLNTQVKVTSPAPFNFVTTTTNDPGIGQPTSIVDVNLNRTDLVYDALGRLSAVWLADRDKSQNALPTMKFTYKVANDKATVVTTEKLRNDGTYSKSYELYDGLLRRRQTQSPAPNDAWTLTDTFYIGTGQAARTNDPYVATGTAGEMPIVTAEGSVNGHTTTYYDGAGRPILGVYGVAGDTLWSTTTSYEGDRTHVSPQNGAVPTTVVTDAKGRTIEHQQHLGDTASGPAQITRYTYTPSGNLESVTDPAGNRWVYHYNQRNLREWTEDPDAGDLRFAYDAAGNLTTSTDELGNVLSYKYDELGRKTEMWQGQVGSGTKLAAWIFDSLAGSKGQLHYSQRFVGSGTYTNVTAMRDKLYRPTKVSYSFPSGDVGPLLGKTYQFTTAYNVDGTAQSAGFPAAGGLPAEAVAVSYDGLMRPTSLTGTSTYVTSTLYSDLGELLQAELYTGGASKKAWLGWEYERGTSRLKRARFDRQGVPTTDMDMRYAHDDAGNVLSITDSATTPGTTDTQCFVYDDLRRLSEAWSHNSNKPCDDGAAQTGVGGPAPYHQSWTFDAAGNRDSETIHSVSGGVDTVRDYSYPNSGQPRPHTVTSIAETGPAGDRSYVYQYDGSGNTTCRPSGATSNSCPDAAGSQKLTWNAQGQLATSKNAGGQETTYVYDADGNRVAVKEPGGRTTVYMPGMELASNGVTVTGTRYYSFAGKTVAVRTPSGVSFEAADHHGTSSVSVNAVSGALSVRRTTPYGATRGTPPGSWPHQKGFVGGIQDPTGLVHLGAREYDTTTGRFVSVDPLVDPNNPNDLGGYSYSANNPSSFSDPDGRKIAPDDDDGGYIPLTQPTKSTVVDQNGVPHVLSGKADSDGAEKGLNFLNEQLKTSGNYIDENRTGSIYVLQNDAETEKLHPKGVITGADGQPTVAGTTADAVKISYINGEIVSVDTYDLTGGGEGRTDEHVKTVMKKMRLDAKQQTQNVVFVAQSEGQFGEMRQRFAGNENVRVIYPEGGLDTGELISKTHAAAMKTRGVSPRTAGQAGKVRIGPKFMGALGALNLVSDIYMMYQVGGIVAEEDPVVKDIKVNMLACSMWMPTCKDMNFSDGYVYTYDGWEWVNTGKRSSSGLHD